MIRAMNLAELAAVKRARRVVPPKDTKPPRSYYVPVAERRERHAAEMRARAGNQNGIMARARTLKGWETRKKKSRTEAVQGPR